MFNPIKRSHTGNMRRTAARRVGNPAYGAALPRAAGFAAVLALLAALVAAPVLAQSTGVPAQPKAPVALVPAQGLVEDLVVEPGDTFAGDAVVYSGDARVGGTVDGNLVVRAGDVEIEPGAHVTGDVTVWSGDVEVGGRVGGNVTTMAGDITLAAGSNVGGDVSTLAGDIKREEGARIGGSILRGPKMSMPEGFSGIPGVPVLPGFQSAPAAPAAPDSVDAGDGSGNPTVVRVERQVRSLGERILGVFGRLILATLLTLLVTALAAIVYNVRPQPIDRARDRLREHTARSFLLGLAVNVTLSVLMAVFFAIFCTAPVGVVVGLALIVLNLAGWTVLALALGRRLAKPATLSQSKFSVNVALGALVLTGVPTYLWALGSFVGVSFSALQIILLILAAPGVGALLWPVFERVSKGKRLNFGRTPGRQSAPGAQTVQGAAVQQAPPLTPAAAAPSAGMTSAASYTTEGNPPEPDPAAAPSPVVDVPVTPPAASGPGESAALDAAGAVGAAAAVEEARRDATEGMAVDETLLETPTQEIPAVVQDEVLMGDAEPASELDEPPPADDFTRVSGIGRTWDGRLKAAGIRTFAQLAAQTPESLAAVLGITVEQVILDDLLGQAQRQ